MLSDKIPKKVSVPISTMSLSPLSSEVSIEIKIRSTPKRKTYVRQYWPQGVLEGHFLQEFGARTGSWKGQTTYRPHSEVKKSTIVKTGLRGGFMMTKGTSFLTGLKAKNGSEWIVVASSDNTKNFSSLGSKEKIFSKSKTILKPKKDQTVLVYCPTVKVSKIRLQKSPDLELKRGFIKHPKPINAPNKFWSPSDASARLVICSHLIGKAKSFIK